MLSVIAVAPGRGTTSVALVFRPASALSGAAGARRHVLLTFTFALQAGPSRSLPVLHPTPFNLHRTMSRGVATKQPLLQAQDPADGTPVKEVAPFLRSLRRMLDTESPRILRWTPDGKAFEIHDMSAMTSYVLPKYFKHRKYASFQRQLNYFHFRKWTKSRAVVCTFSNQFFQRDQPALTWRITRKRVLSPAKHTLTHSNAPKEETRAALPLPTPDLHFAKQLDPVVTVQAAVPSSHHDQLQPDVFGEDASLAWIDVLYPELDMGLLEEQDSTRTDYLLSSKLLWQ